MMLSENVAVFHPAPYVESKASGVNQTEQLCTDGFITCDGHCALRFYANVSRTIVYQGGVVGSCWTGNTVIKPSVTNAPEFEGRRITVIKDHDSKRENLICDDWLGISDVLEQHPGLCPISSATLTLFSAALADA